MNVEWWMDVVPLVLSAQTSHIWSFMLVCPLHLRVDFFKLSSLFFFIKHRRYFYNVGCITVWLWHFTVHSILVIMFKYKYAYDLKWFVLIRKCDILRNSRARALVFLSHTQIYGDVILLTRSTEHMTPYDFFFCLDVCNGFNKLLYDFFFGLSVNWINLLFDMSEARSNVYDACLSDRRNAR